jgi:nucleotide-binding universal stress UspA family protein
VVVHVTPGVYCEPLTGQVIGLPRARAETERWLLAELDQVCDRTGIEVCVITRRGNPARELAAVADHFSADALVIGAPGQRWHQVAGSVPGWLTRHARCPVIVVP